MKKGYLLAFAIFFIANCSAQNTWTSKTAISSAIAEPSSFVIGNFGYVVAGVDNIGAISATWQYDPSADSWTQKADAGATGRYGAFGFSINSMGYVGSGFDNNENLLSDLLQYNPQTNSWTAKTAIPQGRYSASCFVIGSNAYVACGLSDSQNLIILNDVWKYDVSNDTWTQLSAFPGGKRAAASGFSCGGNGYIACGADSDGLNTLNDVWEYTVATDTWTQKSVFTSDAREGATSFVIGNFAYMGAGFDFQYSHNDFWRYDCSNDAWTQITSLPGVERDGAFAFVLNNHAFVGGGYDNNSDPIADNWMYSPDSSLGTNDINLAGTLTVFPNPASEFLTLSVESKNGFAHSSISIYDSRGNLKKSFMMSYKKIIIDLSDYASGIYFVRTISDDGRIIQSRFIKI
jgi:N-acetylneuraminic acid mutarotase